ncbi:catalase HPII [Fibrella forsythiae]|uniref:Catalase n=1 Tax=Fibrella forsythiae TaxID=2817061 RepID=A0ABS3JHE1_9BACT|nr:catalase HPII [Fibrella forsythiae]MBO0949431.1 catalase HPII [Fibrella forsythiae]
METQQNRDNTNNKLEELNQNREDGTGQFLTTNQGLRINDDQNSLKAGDRGATLLEDFILREKITHFDHERIPERIVHARGAAAHGYFQVYEPQAELTKAKFLQDPSVKTPVFLRFSTVAGSRGSSDLARDVRGFAVKFYTEEGNFDLVGNNIPVFFIQDAIKFPDLIHAVKPEPNNEIPQAASAHDTFWDFISITPESMHMIMWVMSDRSIPRSYRMMEGFGVHTFRFINEAGKARFVKFHWKPLLGVHSVVWDEAQLISGRDPDFHRRDLWDSIEAGAYPEWELGVQIVEEEDEHKFDFDLLDSTKLIPEELVPVKRIGKLTLNRNPDNYFAETEQVAFHLGHLVPGLDFTNDPLLQGRLFSYTDTQLKRLGGPNFHEIPINRPVAPVHNGQRDGHMRQTINKGRTSYSPNLINDNTPAQATTAEGGFSSHGERIDARKVRARSKSFGDHYSQANLFWNSQSDAEKTHLVKALRFELSKVAVESIRMRMLVQLAQVDSTLAKLVAEGLGMDVPAIDGMQLNLAVPADANPADYQSAPAKKATTRSAALSMANTVKSGIKTRQVAILAADGVDASELKAMKEALSAEEAVIAIVAPRVGKLKTSAGELVHIDASLQGTASVLFDAVYVPGGKQSVTSLLQEDESIRFIHEAFMHCKAVAATSEGIDLLKAAATGGAAALLSSDGVITGPDDVPQQFIQAIAQHRFWSREKTLV